MTVLLGTTITVCEINTHLNGSSCVVAPKLESELWEIARRKKHYGTTWQNKLHLS
jgi:hypothetical protein